LGSGPNDIAITAVTVSPDSATLTTAGATQQFTAIAWDAVGEPIPRVAFTWHSTNDLVATVDSGGLATAVGNGGARIIVEAGLVSDTAALRVAQPTLSHPGGPTSPTGQAARPTGW
jgi:uncharacterized protein YjdB